MNILSQVLNVYKDIIFMLLARLLFVCVSVCVCVCVSERERPTQKAENTCFGIFGRCDNPHMPRQASLTPMRCMT